jgi:hypothetical protein
MAIPPSMAAEAISSRSDSGSARKRDPTQGRNGRHRKLNGGRVRRRQIAHGKIPDDVAETRGDRAGRDGQPKARRRAIEIAKTVQVHQRCGQQAPQQVVGIGLHGMVDASGKQ